jgi:hypothetical protein
MRRLTEMFQIISRGTYTQPTFINTFIYGAFKNPTCSVTRFSSSCLEGSKVSVSVWAGLRFSIRFSDSHARSRARQARWYFSVDLRISICTCKQAIIFRITYLIIAFTQTFFRNWHCMMELQVRRMDGTLISSNIINSRLRCRLNIQRVDSFLTPATHKAKYT